MFTPKTVLAVCFCAMLCSSQTITISGVVRDSAGVGLPGAAIRLAQADLRTTSGPDGSFTLTNVPTQVSPGLDNRALVATNPVQIRNGTVTVSMIESAPVVVSVHDVGGRQVCRLGSVPGTGTHSYRVPLASTGVYIYRVSIGSRTYSFRASPRGMVAADRTAARDGTPLLWKQAQTSEIITDVIVVIAPRHLQYRDSIRTSDTSGLAIALIPNAGDVTDAEGNTYQSVKIGRQVWTVENWRCTKYADDTPIPHVDDSSSWFALTTPAYCIYNNVTATDTTVNWGALYNWHVVSPANLKQIAPSGWRVPGDADWDTLQNFLVANGYNWDTTKTGNKIGKSMALRTHWLGNAVTGTVANDMSTNNTTGFSACPSGYRGASAAFANRYAECRWWSTTPGTGVLAGNRGLLRGAESLARSSNNKNMGLAVRLVRDY